MSWHPELQLCSIKLCVTNWHMVDCRGSWTIMLLINGNCLNSWDAAAIDCIFCVPSPWQQYIHASFFPIEFLQFDSRAGDDDTQVTPDVNLAFLSLSLPAPVTLYGIKTQTLEVKLKFSCNKKNLAVFSRGNSRATKLQKGEAQPSIRNSRTEGGC